MAKKKKSRMEKVSTNLEPSDYSTLEKIRSKHNISRSEACRVIISNFLKIRKRL